MGFCKNKELEETGGFPPRPFHETKRERKFYEDKKQKALRAIQALEEDMGFYGVQNVDINHWRFELREIIKMVNDI